MASVPLYDAPHHGTRLILHGERNGAGALVIAGQDIGRAPREIFGRDDYEYRYALAPDAEQSLRTALLNDLGTAAGEDTSTEQMLRLAFRRGHLPTPTDLRPYLEDHSITCAFSSF